MDKGRRDMVLGLVFFGGLAVLLWATVELNKISFTPRQEVKVLFETARGLKVGEPVFVLGSLYGQVTAINTMPSKPKLRVEVVMQLDKDVTFKNDAKIKILDSSFLGGKKVNIDPGLEKGLFPRNRTLEGDAPMSPIEAISDLVSGEKNKNNLEEALAGLRKFVDDLNNPEGTLHKLLVSDKIYDDIEAFMASVRKSAEELEKGKSLLGRAIYEEKFGQDIADAAENIKDLTKTLKEGSGLLPRLINDTRMGENADALIADAKEIIENVKKGEGAIGKLFSDKATEEKLTKIVDDVSALTGKLNTADSGLLGALINDEKLLADGRKFVADLSAITDKINSGEGMLAMLINDKDMGRQLKSLFTQVARAVEDAREAAPIGTFFQVFSGAF